MERLYKSWDSQRSLFGDLVVVAFLCTQVLDGIFTYLGVSRWGLGIEANPIVSSAVMVAGPGVGLSAVKITAIGFGMLLHLRRVHNLVALLTAVYFALAIFPWAAIFFTQ
jgi:hypothetical protein